MSESEAQHFARELLDEIKKQRPDTDQIKWLIDRADMNLADARGATPLMNISSWGNHELMQKMLVHGAKINQKGPGGNTVAHMVAASGNNEAMSTMLSYGADFAALNDAGKTPFDLAQGKYDAEMTGKLQKRFEEQDPGIVKLREITAYIDEQGLRLSAPTPAPPRAEFRPRKP